MSSIPITYSISVAKKLTLQAVITFPATNVYDLNYWNELTVGSAASLPKATVYDLNYWNELTLQAVVVNRLPSPSVVIVNAVLLEDGTFVLLEDGTNLLLE